MATVNETLTSLANEVRNLSGVTEPLGLEAMTNNIEEANNEIETQATIIEQLAKALQGKGAINGANGIYWQGYENGQQEEYDSYWANHKISSSRLGDYMFAGPFWDDNTFKPPIGSVFQPTRAYMMFAGVNITDLVKICEERQITIDFSKATQLSNLFYGAYGGKISHIGIIDTRSSKTVNSLFYGALNLETIDKLILKEDGSQTFATLFLGANGLVNLTISGTIGNNSVDLHWSTKLSKASIESVINALSDTTSGLTVTLSNTAVLAAFGNTTSDEWVKLIATKPNWTITLA